MTLELTLRAVIREEMRELKVLLGQGTHHQALSFSEAAGQLGVGLSTVKRMVSRGELVPVKIGKRLMIPQAEMDRLFQTPNQPASSPRRWKSFELPPFKTRR